MKYPANGQIPICRIFVFSIILPLYCLSFGISLKCLSSR